MGPVEVSFRETTEAPVQDFQELPIFLKSVYRRLGSCMLGCSDSQRLVLFSNRVYHLSYQHDQGHNW